MNLAIFTMTLFLAPAQLSLQATAPDDAETLRTTGNWLVGTGAAMFLASYAVTVGVSVASDPGCEGPTCNERYLSIIPVVGPVVQFSVAGKDFHDAHHTDACFPRAVAAVGGQAVGLAAFIAGFVLRSQAEDEAAAVVEKLSLSTDTYGGTGFGVRVGVIGF